MAGGEERASNEAILRAIPLTVAADAPPPARRFRFAIPRFVDYLIVAAFIYFVF